MKILLILMISQIALARQNTVIGKPIAQFLSPPNGVLMKIHNQKVTFTYVWEKGEPCIQNVWFNEAGIITKFSDSGIACEESKPITSDYRNHPKTSLPQQDLASLGQQVEE